MYFPEFSPAAVGGLLRELSVEEKTIREIVKILENGADDIQGGQPMGVRPTAFGGSWSGAALGHHTDVAHQHVVEAMKNMVTGLRGYEQNVRRFNDDVVFVDEDGGDRATKTAAKVQAAPLVTIDQANACTGPGDFTSNDRCPTPRGEG